jgi:kynureninase
MNKLDKNDTLYCYKEKFHLIEDACYMDGNSLGLMSINAEKKMYEAMNDWKEHGIKIWGLKEGKYFMYPQLLGGMMSKLIGAEENEVIALGSITTNIHQALMTFYKPTKARHKILVDELNFPTDRYAVESVLEQKNQEDSLVVVESRDGKTLAEEDIINALKEDVSILLLPSVLYRSAQLLDLEKITKAAHEKGIIVGFDLAHSIGVVDHDFSRIQADFAVWCTYKYLNGGPGSVGGLYINKRHFDKTAGLRGWFGNRNESQFQLNPTIDQTKDASGWLQGTPHIMALAALEGSLELYNEVGVKKLRKKSLALTSYMMDLIDSQLYELGFSIGNPRQDSRRGGHVCLEHDEAYRISQALRDNGVIPDFREPNVIRLAPVPLYTSFEDVEKVIEIIDKVTRNKLYEGYSSKRETVV